MLSAIMLGVIMLSFIYTDCRNESHYSDYPCADFYDEYCYTECYYFEYCYDEFQIL
jgi:hypothetical protein